MRIGRDDTSSKHTVCSKTTTNHDANGTTTTTKITIDLTPSPTADKKLPQFPSVVKFPRASLHNFKSTSLILNTIRAEASNGAQNGGRVPSNDERYVRNGECFFQNHKQSLNIENGSHANRNGTQNITNALANHRGISSERSRAIRNEKAPKIPQQLEALRRLYDNACSDSETDKEVQSLTGVLDSCDKKIDEDCSSVVSGSWSKMRALKNLNHFTRFSDAPERDEAHAHLGKGNRNIDFQALSTRRYRIILSYV